MFDFIKNAYESIDWMHAFGLFLLTFFIPFLSMIAIWGIQTRAFQRMKAMLSTFPELKNTESYKAFNLSESKIAIKPYLVPLILLLCLNFLLSKILIDGSGAVTTISSEERFFLLCGGKCVGVASTEDVGAYETQTLVIISYAFVGWMVWTLTAIYDRVATQQLYPATLNRMVVRLVVAVLVAVVMRHFAEGYPDAVSIGGPTLAFLVGMFPDWAIALISSKLQNIGRSPLHSEDFDLELIEGIGAKTAYRLPEISIEDGSDLAHANPFRIYQAIALPMSEVVDWIGQAQLLLLLKADRTQTMQKAGYRTIFDLVRVLKTGKGRESVQTLCNWSIPEDYDLAAAIQADGDYQRLHEVCKAMGTAIP